MGQEPKKYHVTDDGKIYRVNEDGSFTEMGNVEDSASAKDKNRNDNTTVQQPDYAPYEDYEYDEQRGKKKWWYIASIIIIVAAGFLVYTMINNVGSNDEASVDIVKSNSDNLIESADRVSDVEPINGNVHDEKVAVSPKLQEQMLSSAGTFDSICLANPSDGSVENNTTIEDTVVVVEHIPESPKIDYNKVYDVAEQEPEFPGGQYALQNWVAAHIQYPADCQYYGIQGRVVVQFVVTKNGSVGEVKVARGKHPDLDNEAVRVVKSLPRFTPGMMNGHAVNVWYTLPITFKLTSL